MRNLIDRFIRSLPVFKLLIEGYVGRIKSLENEVFELEHAECDKCKILQGQLEYERDRTTHLLDLISPRIGVQHQRAVGTKSWSVLQHELEQKSLKSIGKSDDREE